MTKAFQQISPAAETRYSRQELIHGWQQEVLTRAKVLVVGAGALGNEVLKNLALSGVGHIGIVDFDVVEISNLSRCVLFNESDLGLNKARTATNRLMQMNSNVTCTAFETSVVTSLGAGTVRDYDLVLGAVDSVEARLAIHRLCRAAEVSWMDGGMDARGGQVSFFNAHIGACYECGMTASMWERVAERQGCLRMGTGEVPEPAKMAATVAMAANIGAIQAQECVRFLMRSNPHGVATMQPGERICLQTTPYQIVVLQSPLRKDCAQHSNSRSPESFAGDVETTSVTELLQRYDATRLVLSWDVASQMECARCAPESCAIPMSALTRERLSCPECGSLRTPVLQSSVTANTPLAQCTLAQIGAPPRAILELCVREANADEDAVFISVEVGAATRYFENAEG